MHREITFVSKCIYTGLGKSFPGFVRVVDGKIHSVGSGVPSDVRNVIDVGDNKVIPGLIDLHIHGSAGKSAMAKDLDELYEMAKFLAKNGVTAFQPTTGAAPKPVLEHAVKVVRDFTRGPVKGARSIGLHMEGPFLNSERKGAMPAEFLLKPDLELMKKWVALGDGTIKQVTIAPELPGALEVVRYLANEGITVSVGHTLATYEETLEGLRAGITVACHTYNAMRELHHREPGVLGAVLTQNGIYCELIADGIHVHRGAMALLVASKGPDYVCLITDAVIAAGLPRGEYDFIGQRITIDEFGKVTLPDGTIAGSTALLRNCLKNMVELVGLPFETALTMATVNPAKAAHVFHRKGSLSPGKDADVVVMDDKYNVLWCLVEGEVQKSPDSVEGE